MDMESSPKQNVEEEMKSAEIIAKEVSPKHNVEEIEEKKEEEMKSVDIEEFSRKPVVEIEEMMEDTEDEEMESIDIHEEEGDKIVTMDEIMSVDSDDDDSESSAESNDETGKAGEEAVDDRSGISHHSSPESNSSTSSAWTEKAAAIKNFVRVKSEVAVHTLIRRLSGKLSVDNAAHGTRDDEVKSVDSPKTEGKSMWNPLSYLKMMQNDDDSVDREEEVALEPVVMKGRIILYTRLGCEECRESRLFLHEKRLGYVEINIDIYPSRKLELEKICGGDVVPKVFFNEELVGSFKELKVLEESGELEEKIKHLIEEAPPREAPLPPFSGEDDASSKGPVDELALIVLKMKPCVVKDRFYKMRRFKNCFLGSEAVDFLSADQSLERDGVSNVIIVRF